MADRDRIRKDTGRKGFDPSSGHKRVSSRNWSWTERNDGVKGERWRPLGIIPKGTAEGEEKGRLSGVGRRTVFGLEGGRRWRMRKGGKRAFSKGIGSRTVRNG